VIIDLGGNITMELVLIPAGEFLMGTPGEDVTPWETQHKVTITRAFYMGVYEVTQEQYAQIMGQNDRFKNAGDRMPVVDVSWDDAREFCRRLSHRVGAIVRFPTEAEWEYACRAGSQAAYFFGDDPSKLGEYAWFQGNSNVHYPGEQFENMEEPRSVGKKKPNAFGLYDMHGNVGEWCRDYADTYTGDAQIDPTGPASGRSRIYRGGGYMGDHSRCRSAARNWESRRWRSLSLGFRVVME